MTTSSGRMAFSRCSSTRQLCLSLALPCATQKAMTWPVACTPASVRPAKRTLTRSPVSLLRASSSSPCTVRAFGWTCEPAKAVPSYSTTARAHERTEAAIGLHPARLDELDLHHGRRVPEPRPNLHDSGVPRRALCVLLTDLAHQLVHDERLVRELRNQRASRVEITALGQGDHAING